MAEVLKIVSVQRGYDPRDFALAAFGGAGPLHAAALADELAIREVICPPIPGAFSALGLIGTDLKRDYVRTLHTSSRGGAALPAVLEAAFAALEREGAAMLDRAGVMPERRRFERTVDARYARQAYELAIPVAQRPVVGGVLAQIARTFHDRHLSTYGHDNRTEPVEIVSARLAAVGAIAPLSIRDEPARSATEAVKVQTGDLVRETGNVHAAIYDRKSCMQGRQRSARR
jgi:N-methylhydantoinase A